MTDKKKQLDEELLTEVTGGANKNDGTSDSPQSPVLAAANKKNIKEYKEYIIPNGV